MALTFFNPRWAQTSFNSDSFKDAICDLVGIHGNHGGKDEVPGDDPVIVVVVVVVVFGRRIGDVEVVVLLVLLDKDEPFVVDDDDDGRGPSDKGLDQEG